MGASMARGLYLAVTLFMVSASLLSGQATSAVDLRADERELQRYQWQLQQDRNKLVMDRRNHATRLHIREDQAQINRDKAVIRTLRTNIQRERRNHHRYPI
jgi:hypothetical protein